MKKSAVKERKSYERITGQSDDFILWAVLETLVLMMLGASVFDLVVKILGVDWDNFPAYIRVAQMYFAFIGIWIAIFLSIFLSKPNKPMIKAVAFDKKMNNWKGLLIGSALGFGMNGACILFSVLLGDIGLVFDKFEILPLLLIFICVMVQSGAEELVTRMYLYQKICRRYKNPVVAVAVNSIFFTLLHGGNPGIGVFAVLQILLVAVLLSLIIYYFNSFWMCVMVHTVWNFTQNIIFGCPNSGIVTEYSIFKLDAASNGFFFDTKFGVEGSIGACLIILAACVAVVLIGKKKGIKPVDIWAEDERRLEAEAAAAKNTAEA